MFFGGDKRGSEESGKRGSEEGGRESGGQKPLAQFPAGATNGTAAELRLGAPKRLAFEKDEALQAGVIGMSWVRDGARDLEEGEPAGAAEEAEGAGKESDGKGAAKKVSKKDLENRHLRVSKKDRACVEELYQSIRQCGADSSVESWKKMLLGSGEKEVGSVRTVGLEGLVSADMVWGDGLLMLTEGQAPDGSKRTYLHVVASVTDASLEARERWTSKKVFCCFKQSLEVSGASYDYRGSHGHRLLFKSLPLDGLVSEAYVDFMDSSEFSATSLGSRDSHCECKSCCALSCCLSCCPSCCWKPACCETPCMGTRELGGTWRKKASVEEDRELFYTVDVRRERTMKVAESFPNIEAPVEMEERCAIVATSLHSLNIHLSGQAITAVVSPDEHVSKLAPLCTRLGQMRSGQGPELAKLGGGGAVASSRRRRRGCWPQRPLSLRVKIALALLCLGALGAGGFMVKSQIDAAAEKPDAKSS